MLYVRLATSVYLLPLLSIKCVLRTGELFPLHAHQFLFFIQSLSIRFDGQHRSRSCTVVENFTNRGHEFHKDQVNFPPGIVEMILIRHDVLAQDPVNFSFVAYAKVTDDKMHIMDKSVTLDNSPTRVLSAVKDLFLCTIQQWIPPIPLQQLQRFLNHNLCLIRKGCVDLIHPNQIHFTYKYLRTFSEHQGPTIMYGDNDSDITKTTIPHSKTTRHNCLSSERNRECITAADHCCFGQATSPRCLFFRMMMVLLAIEGSVSDTIVSLVSMASSARCPHQRRSFVPPWRQYRVYVASILLSTGPTDRRYDRNNRANAVGVNTAHGNERMELYRSVMSPPHVIWSITATPSTKIS